MRVRNNMRILMAKHEVNSVSKISRETKIPYSSLINFYHEKYETFNADMIKKLCSYFNCEIGELLYLEKGIA